MSEQGSGKSHHVKVWLLIVLVGLPLLYVLSVPPICSYAIHYGRYRRAHSPPRWLEKYMHSYLWLHVHTPLRKPLADYFSLWVPHLRLPTRLTGNPPLEPK